MAITNDDIAAVTKRMFEDAKMGQEGADQALDRVSFDDIDKKKEQQSMLAMPVDLYQKNQDISRVEMKKAHPRGASTLTNKIAEEELVKLSKQKKRAEMDANYWKERGDKEREQLVKDQYLEERFLPTVELLIISSTPDEILNSKNILKSLDDLTFEYGPGYTASYIRTAYGDQLGNASSRSDGYVQSMVERLKYLSSSDQIRAAYGVAKKLKDEIDNGEHTADESDYEIITRVASIG